MGSRWYMVLRSFPWESVVVAGEPLRGAVAEPGEPERMVPLFSTLEAAEAWGSHGDQIVEVVMGENEVTHG